MKKASILNFSQKVLEEILGELWEDAVFNEKSLKALKQIAMDLAIPDEAIFSLSTTRNRNLITKDQQTLLKKTTVGFFGLSVGSHAALTWMMQSRADTIKIADPDKITPSNLNRMRVGWQDIGSYKVDVIRKELLSINPLASVIGYIGKEIDQVKKLFDVHPKMDVVVDEIDDLYGKMFLRKLAKKDKIPLLSAADCGDNVILDIERYDLIPQPQFFLGQIQKLDEKKLAKMSDLKKKKQIIKLVGFDKSEETMLKSLLALGTNLGTWPQLGATATMAGGIITTAIKKIILGEKVQSGRYYISLDDILTSDFESKKRRSYRQKLIDAVKKKLNLENI